MPARSTLPFLIAAGLWACDGEPIDLTPPVDVDAAQAAGGQPGGSGGSGGQAGGSGGQAGGAGGSAPVEGWPTEAVLDAFAPEIVTLLDAKCASCHPGAPAPDDGNLAFTPSDAASLSDDARLSWLREIEEFCHWGDGAASPLVLLSRGVGHPAIWGTGSEDDVQLVAFIDQHEPPPPPVDMGVEAPAPDLGPDVDMGPAGSAGVPCEGLPSSDPLDRPGFYEDFETNINDLLIGSCGESVCHGTPNAGGRYWVATQAECATEWNFTTALSFIDYGNPSNSPLSEQPVSPNHGGREVFSGRADPRFVALRNWIISGTP